MRPILWVMIVLSMHWQHKAHANPHAAEASPGETIVGALLVGTGLGLIVFALHKRISYVIAHDDELSNSRKDKYGLLEAGKANDYGSSFAAGGFVNEDQLVFGRLSQHLSPDGNINFSSQELGYRHYASIWFGRLNPDDSSKEEARNQYKVRGTGYIDLGFAI
ncbi:MAG: hypothetical protein M3Q07_24840 [Pseudobdellovibrionaceae bacterium]|nr:hypothetical protein [Pseudobdellovibrionaceae bacterium]